MSFDIICSGCGAMSGPSVGICPFCKNVMTKGQEGLPPQAKLVSDLYREGKIETALSLANKIYREDESSKKDVAFLLYFVKILLETEGPLNLMKAVLQDAFIQASSNQEVLDYMEVVESKSLLNAGMFSAAKIQLRNVIRRAPQNLHAHFILAGHLFWAEKKQDEALPHLEACLRLAPNFLRVWGCLGTLYKMRGNLELARHAFQKCVELEKNPRMKEFFERELQDLSV